MTLRRAVAWAVGGGVAVVALLGLAGVAVGIAISAPGHEGPVSDHFDGTRFHNTEPTELPGLGRAARLLAEGRGPAWEPRTFPAAARPPERVRGALRATFINHSTVLMQHDGLNVLTDPIWSERCSAVSWAGPRRHHAPGLALDALPPIDVVLVSHNHYDHLDLPTLHALAERDDPVFVVPLGVGPWLRDQGLRDVRELDWGQQATVGHLVITGQEVRHFSSRGLLDRMKTLWLGYVVEGADARWYVAGDTGDGPHFAATGAAHGPFDLALIPIGAYGPRWFMAPIHIDPAQAVAAHQALGARRSLGIHHGTFRLTNEGQDAPVEELAAAREAAGLPESAFFTLRPGAHVELHTGPALR